MYIADRWSDTVFSSLNDISELVSHVHRCNSSRQRSLMITPVCKT